MLNLKGLNQDQIKELLPDNLILLGYRGSISHGMYLNPKNENSIDDKDIMGIFIAPIDYYVGIKNIRETKEKFLNEWDSVCYELKKMINLLIKGNPNVLSLLWLKDNYYIYQTEYSDLLIENRNIFTSKKIYHSFVGYAWGQFHRMTHYKFEGYMGEKRKKLVDKYGYDCKNASHLIRLLKMAIEFLNEGVLYVEREVDAQYLLEIKNGEYTLEQIKKEAERFFKLAEESYMKCTLSNEPDYEKINNICKKILLDYLKCKNNLSMPPLEIT
jgi:predicted nucleotidyltransferase